MMYQFKGQYDGDATYSVGDVVTYGGIAYVCVLDGAKDHPTHETNWHKLNRNLADTANMLESAVSSRCRWVGEVDLTKDGSTGDIGYVEDDGDLLLCIWIEEAWFTAALTEAAGT